MLKAKTNQEKVDAFERAMRCILDWKCPGNLAAQEMQLIAHNALNDCGYSPIKSRPLKAAIDLD